MSQRDLILEALRCGEALTPLSALRRFGTFRLGARILELREAGYRIVTDKVKLRGRTWVAQYRMV